MHWWYWQWSCGSAYGAGHQYRGAGDLSGADPAPNVDTPSEREADGILARSVAEALLDDPVITAGLVEVDVQNGVVILDGDVDTEAACMAASARVWSVPGVTDVCNALQVIPRSA